MWCLLAGLASLAGAQTAVEYVGGTTSQLAAGTHGSIALSDDRYLAFYAGKLQLRVAYDRVNLIEYGQQVDRRLALAFVISPVFLLSKAWNYQSTGSECGVWRTCVRQQFLP